MSVGMLSVNRGRNMLLAGWLGFGIKAVLVSNPNRIGVLIHSLLAAAKYGRKHERNALARDLSIIEF